MYLLIFLIWGSTEGALVADRLRPLVLEVDGHLAANFRNVTEAVLVVGAPGTGKTALSMLLAQDASLRLQRSPDGVLLADDARMIGRDAFLPNFMRDDVLGTVLVDCPAPTEPEEAVVAAEYAVIRTAALLRRAKVVVVENFFSFAEGGDKIGDRRLKDLIRKFGPVAAVVSSKGVANPTSVKSHPQLSAPVVIFPRPFRPGSPIETLQATAEGVRKALNNAEWNAIKPEMSDKMRCFANEMLAGVVNETKSEFVRLLDNVYEKSLVQIENSTDHFEDVSHCFETLLHFNSTDYNSLAKNLNNYNFSSDRLDVLTTQLNWLHDLGLEIPLNVNESVMRPVVQKFEKIVQFYDFMNATDDVLRNYKFIRERAHLAAALEEQTFDNIFVSAMALDLQPRPQLLGLNMTNWMKRDFEKILNEKLKFKNWSNKGVVFSAPFIVLSEVAKNFKPQNDSIVLMASEIIFLDQDLLVQNGKNLIIIAPEVQVVKENLTLTLKGRTGAGHQNASTEGDGAAGQPGGPAGNLLLICTRMINPEHLLVLSIGGDGGEGQQGAPATQGEFHHSEDTLEFFQPFQNITSSNRTSGAVRVAYQDGRTDSTPATDGGVGGEGGHPGAVVIYKMDLEANEVRTELRRGEQGPSGEGGKSAPPVPKFKFVISDCGDSDCVEVSGGQSWATRPALAAGVAGQSRAGWRNATEAPPVALRRFLYLYVGTILAKELDPRVEAEVVQLVERLPEIIRRRGGETEGGLQHIEAEWAVMEREKSEMRRALGRHLPLMHRILLAYADIAPGGRRLSELIRNTQ